MTMCVMHDHVCMSCVIMCVMHDHVCLSYQLLCLDSPGQHPFLHCNYRWFVLLVNAVKVVAK